MLRRAYATRLAYRSTGLRAAAVRWCATHEASPAVEPFGGASFDYDLCVIGGGPSGYAAAIRGYDFGKKVCLIDAEANRAHHQGIGGAAVHNGALSSKMMWKMARDHRAALLLSDNPEDSIHKRTYKEIVEKIGKAQTQKVEQVQRQIESLFTSPMLQKEYGEDIARIDRFGSIHRRVADFTFTGGTVELIPGYAKFSDKNTVDVELEQWDGDKKVGTKHLNLSAGHFVIATGSSPRVLSGLPCDHEHVITSDDVLSLKEFPKSLLIVGAGVIGCEFATIFANFGQTEVKLINNRRPRLLHNEDSDLSKFVTKNLCDLGVEVVNEYEMASLEIKEDTDNQFGDGKKVVCTLKHPETEEVRVLEASHCLLSIGRVPNTKTLGLEEIGVEQHRKGGIVTDEDSRTTQPHIFAAGDVTADIGLVSVGEMEARHSVEKMFCAGAECPTELSYQNIASIMFLEPEVACVGDSEAAALAKGIPIKVGIYSFELVNRALISPVQTGYVKLVVANDGTDRLLGMRAIGQQASAVIGPAQLVIANGQSVRRLERILFPHPAISESVQECARMFSGRSIMKPHCFVTQLRMEEVTPPSPDPTYVKKFSVPTYK